MKRPLLTLLITLCLSLSAFAGESAKAAFERLKRLEGTWEGMAGVGGQMQKTQVIYKVTGGGSALVETQFPGSAHEMVTVYHLDGDSLVLTHYCAAHNQPTMRLAPGDDPAVLTFEFVRGSNMKADDMHMRGVTHRLTGEDTLLSEWSSYMKGKRVGTARFEMKRVKA